MRVGYRGGKRIRTTIRVIIAQHGTSPLRTPHTTPNKLDTITKPHHTLTHTILSHTKHYTPRITQTPTLSHNAYTTSHTNTTQYEPHHQVRCKSEVTENASSSKENKERLAVKAEELRRYEPD
jgi:hypothetical protein